MKCIMQITAVIAFAAVTSLAIISIGCLIDKNNTQDNHYRQQQYQSWTKLYYRQDLTFEEWDALRTGNFLDGYKTPCSSQLEK